MAEKKGEVITRPSLVIGLGGTGHETVRYLKRRFYETNNGKLPDLVRLVCFDTTAEATESIMDRNENEVLLAANEFWNLGGYNVDRQVQNIQGMVEYKETLAWFPKELRPGQVDQGAQITRPIGRLSLLLKEKRVKSIIKQAMKSLHLIWKKRFKDTKENMDVYFISSLCGGTGSGMFIDLPYITEMAAMEEKIKSFQRIGILLLPSAFSTALSADLMIRAEANTYAALKELDYFMEQARFDYIPWQGKIRKIEKRPFDACYLMDTTNEDELKLEDQTSAMQLIAESLFLKVSTQIGRAGAQEENNIFGGLGVLGQTANGKLTAYSAFGVAFATYPVDEIIRFCSSRLTKEIVIECLVNDNNAGKEEISNEIDGYLKGQGLMEEQIVERLTTDETGDGKIEKISVKIGPDRFKDYSDVELVGILRNFVEGYRREKITKFSKIIRDRKEALTALFLESLNKKFQQLIDEGHKGFPRVKRFMETLLDRFSKKQDEVREKREGLDGIKSKLETSERTRDRILLQIEEASQGFRLKKQSRKVHRLRDDFIGELVRYYNLELKQFALNQATETFGELIGWVNERIKDVDNIIKKLKLIADRIDNSMNIESERKGSIEFLLGQSAINKEDVLKLYEKQVNDKEKMAMELLAHIEDVYSWKSKNQELIRNEMISFYEDKFGVFRKYNVEDMLVGNGFAASPDEEDRELHRKKATASPTEILKNLYKRATPFWVYDNSIMDPRGNLGDELSEILVVGTEDEEKTIFQGHELPYKINFTSIKDPSKIAIDRNHHGLPLFALWGMESFEGMYDDLVAKNVPLHVFKGAEKFPKITRPLVDQQEAEKRDLYFILGRVLGIIYKRGLTYFLQHPHHIFGNEEMVEKPISEGLEKAREAVLRDVELVRIIKENVDKQIDKMGNTEAKQFLLEYMKKHREELSEAEMEVIQEYREQL